MATYFSDNYTSTAAGATSLESGFTPNVVDIHGRLRVKSMRFTADAILGTSDILRMGTFKSSDHLIALYLTSDDMGTTGDINVGLYLKGTDSHDGAVADVDLFGSAIDVNANALTFTEILGEAGTITAATRGKALWEQLAAGAGSDTEDPDTHYDLVINPSEATTNTSGVLALFAIYTAGD